MSPHLSSPLALDQWFVLKTSGILKMLFDAHGHALANQQHVNVGKCSSTWRVVMGSKARTSHQAFHTVWIQDSWSNPSSPHHHPVHRPASVNPKCRNSIWKQYQLFYILHTVPCWTSWTSTRTKCSYSANLTTHTTHTTPPSQLHSAKGEPCEPASFNNLL